MSIKDVQELVKGLPWGIAEQVTSYARSVEDALPQIFRDSGQTFNSRVADQVIFLAGVRKLHGIVASSYWTLENSGKLLESMDVSAIRAGSHDLTRGGKLHDQLYSLLKSLENVLEKQDIKQYLNLSYADLVTTFARDGRRRN